MTDLAKDNLFITAFLLLVLDRLAVLYVVKVKAEKVLAKNPTTTNGRRKFQKQALEILDADYWLILAIALLAAFGLLGWMQIDDREIISNDIGRVLFAGMSFLLSIAGTMMNLCVERLSQN